MRAHVPGIHIPDSVIDRLERARSPAAEGTELCIELMQRIRAIPGVAGVHVMAYRREHLVSEIVLRSGVRGGRRVP
jgi:methylenetetrahydrofolate reductase (NADPH)